MKNFSNHFYNKTLRSYAQELRSEIPTKAERRLWKSKLCRSRSSIRFIRQRAIDNFIVDFFSPDLRLIIEIDGNSHYHKPEYDKYREEKLRSLGFEILRFTEGQVLNDLDAVCLQIDHSIHCLQLKS